MKFLLILILPFSLSAASLPEIEDAKASIKSLIAPMLAGKKNRPKETDKFRVDGCEKYNVPWMDVLMLKSSFAMNFAFKEGCDIQGVVTPKVFQPFPASLKLRNISSFHQMDTQNKLNSTFESKPVLNLEMRDGKLTGKKGKVRFEADYEVQLNPMNKANPIEKNLGGIIRITEIYGVKVSIKEKIMID